MLLFSAFLWASGRWSMMVIWTAIKLAYPFEACFGRLQEGMACLFFFGASSHVHDIKPGCLPYPINFSTLALLFVLALMLLSCDQQRIYRT
jgi:hypothetical protein